MYNVLAIDTATQQGSVALLHNNQLLTEAFDPQQNSSVQLLSKVQNILCSAQLTKKELHAIAFGRGPGSFTGIRLASSVAQAMGFALNIPVIPVSTLHALAQQVWRCHQSRQVLVTLDARLKQVYWGCYRWNAAKQSMQLWGEEKLDALEEVRWPTSLKGPWLGIGKELMAQSIAPEEEWIDGFAPNAYDIATIAHEQIQAGSVVRTVDSSPSYLRDRVTQT